MKLSDVPRLPDELVQLKEEFDAEIEEILAEIDPQLRPTVATLVHQAAIEETTKGNLDVAQWLDGIALRLRTH